MQSELEELNNSIEGEVKSSHLDRLLYSSDASIYQELPLAVVCPKKSSDCQEIVAWAARTETPLIPRAAGTSLAGQVVGSGLVIDSGRHMRAVGDLEGETIWVEPGVILDNLNDQLRPQGLLFGPDTSTSNRCMIAGMIGNNSCGEHSIVHGTTRDHCLAIEALLSDGSAVSFGPLSAEELQRKCSQDDLEGQIYSQLCELIETQRKTIINASPKPSILRRNMGYALDYLANCQPWNPDGKPFNLAPFICGSEGTLCLVTRAKLNLIRAPRQRILLCAHFDSVIEACRATPLAVAAGAAAVELIDDKILNITKENITQNRNRFWLKGEPKAVLVIEFYAEEIEEARAKAHELEATFGNHNFGHAFSYVEGSDIARVWALRKAGLGLLMGVVGDRKAQPIIEDAAVAVEDLADYVTDIDAIMQQHGVELIYYAHASVGLLHLRPELNLKDPHDVASFKAIASDVAQLVKKYGGSFSGEHGDGRLRAPFIEEMVGPELYNLFAEVKTIFDPANLFNPHKIIAPKAIDSDLKIKPGPHRDIEDTFFDWSREGGLIRATERCNGAGVCRKTANRPTMCPSYQATLEEENSPRGRANVFRQFLISSSPHQSFESSEIKQVLDLCLSCKACRSECPANVDVAKLKAEFLQQYYQINGSDSRSSRFAHFSSQAKFASLAPKLIGAIANLTPVKKALGIHPARSLPRFCKQKLSIPARSSDSSKVVNIYVDEFSQYLDLPVVEAAIDVITKLGYHPNPILGLDSGRAAISKGFLKLARQQATKTVKKLAAVVESGEMLIGLEPSAALGFGDDIPDLFREPELKAAAQRVGDKLMLFEEWINQLPDNTPFAQKSARILIHGHCHCKSLLGSEPLTQAFERFSGVSAELISSGCCGMAGSFGYEREHYELSMQIGEQSLFPALRAANADTLICAHGHSCRHQIKDGTGREALHPAQIMARLLDTTP